MKKAFSIIILLLLPILCFAEEKIIYQNTRYNTSIFFPTEEYIELSNVGKLKGGYCLSTITYRKNSNTGRMFYIYSQNLDTLKSLVYKLESSTWGTDSFYDNHICDIVAANKSKFKLISEETDITHGIPYESYKLEYLE